MKKTKAPCNEHQHQSSDAKGSHTVNKCSRGKKKQARAGGRGVEISLTSAITATGEFFFLSDTTMPIYAENITHVFHASKNKTSQLHKRGPQRSHPSKTTKKNDKQRRRRTENASTTRETRRRVPVRPIIFSSGADKEAAKSATSPTQPYRIVTLCRRLLGSAM